MLLDNEIDMLKKRLNKVSRNVDDLTHPYMLQLSRMLDVRLNKFESIKKSAFLDKGTTQFMETIEEVLSNQKVEVHQITWVSSTF